MGEVARHTENRARAEPGDRAENRAGAELGFRADSEPGCHADSEHNIYTEPYRSIVVSDPHGAKRFWLFIQYALLSTGKQGVYSPEHPSMEYAGISDLYILGDILDRAKDPIGTFQIIQKLMKSKHTHYVTGNHDLYAFMNIIGLHLPCYDGYKGIDESYSMFVDGVQFVPRQWLEKELSQAGAKQGVRSKSYWARAFAEYVAYAEDRQKEIWDEQLRIASELFAGAFATSVDREKGNDALNFPDKHECSESLKNDVGLRRWWSEILGHNVGTIVYTGLKAVDKMSINWWLDKQLEMKKLQASYSSREFLWQQMGELITKILSEYQKKLDDEYKNDNREWLVIDAIMYRHYESTEWNAFDWVFHKGWGSLGDGFLAKRNEVLLHEDSAPLDYSNYLNDPLVNEMGEFYLKSFSLFKRDAYGNYLMHAMLPFDEDGDISIGFVDAKGELICEQDGRRVKGLIYKGLEYQGNAVFEGLCQLAEDVSTFDPAVQSPAEILEALTLVNSIYADETTIVKPSIIARTLKRIATGSLGQDTAASSDVQLLQAGACYALAKAGVPALFCGHNPHDKLADQGINRVMIDQNGAPMIIHTDGGMAAKFGDKGTVIFVNNDTPPEMLIIEYDKHIDAMVEQDRIEIDSWSLTNKQ